MELVNSFVNQQFDIVLCARKTRTLRDSRNKQMLMGISTKITDKQIRISDIYLEMCVSNWLNVLALKYQGFYLNNQECWDAIRLRYGWEIPN